MHLPGGRKSIIARKLMKDNFMMVTAILTFLTVLAAGMYIVLAALVPSPIGPDQVAPVAHIIRTHHHMTRAAKTNNTTALGSTNESAVADERNHHAAINERNNSSFRNESSGVGVQNISEAQTVHTAPDKTRETTPSISVENKPCLMNGTRRSDVNEIIEKSLSSKNAEPYELADGPLSCDQVWPLLEKKNKGTCKLTWPEGSSLPDVVCAYIGGYRPIGGSYTALIYTAATYRLLDKPVRPLPAGECDRSLAGYCAFQTGFVQRKVDSLSKEDAPVGLDESLLQIAEGEGEEGTTHRILVSQGLKYVSLDLRPEGLGAKGAMFTIPDCQEDAKCDLDIWVIKYAKTISIVHLYMNRAWRIIMEFNPAYMKLATHLLNYLKEDSYLEELVVTGGELWDDGTVLPVKLVRMRSIDFSSNGLSKLDDANFERVPELVELNLSHNDFSTVPNGVSLLSKLRVLDMSFNPLVPKPLVPMLRSLSDLRLLNLSFTKLGGFEPLDDPEDDGVGNNTSLIPRLQTLDLSACKITNLSTVAVRRVLRRTALHRLVLSSNRLQSPVPPSLIERLPSLQVLALANCSLHLPLALRIPSGVRLHLLDLADNELETPTNVVAENDLGVRELNLSGNVLRRGWGVGAFSALGLNASVNLSRVGVETLDANMLHALESLQQVDLGANPLDCNLCATSGLRAWLTNRTRPSVLSLGSNVSLRCAHPPSVRGRAIVTALAYPPREVCEPRPQRVAGGWSGPAVAGTVIAVALLAAAFLAFIAFRFRLELVYVLHVLRANRAIKSSNSLSDEENECEFDAFVCYSKFDRAWVLGELLPRLEDCSPRYRLCLHERDFPLGSLIVQNIVECMARSRRTLIVLTKAFIDSQWCQWELEMATQRLLDSACRDYLVLVELERLDVRALPRLLRLLVETRTLLQWPEGGRSAAGCCGRGGDNALETAWRRLRTALGPPLRGKETEAAAAAPITRSFGASGSFHCDRASARGRKSSSRKSRRESHAVGDPPVNNTLDSPSHRRTPKALDLSDDTHIVARKRNTLTREGSKDSNLGRNQDSMKSSNREVCNIYKAEKGSNNEKSLAYSVIDDEFDVNILHDKLNQLNSEQLSNPSSSSVIQQNVINVLMNQKNNNTRSSEKSSCSEERKCISSKNKNVFVVDISNENSFDSV